LLRYSEMKKGDNNKKEVTKIKLKKTKDSMVNKRRNQRKQTNQTSGKKYVRILNLSVRHIINSERNEELQKKKKRKEG